MGDEPRMAVVFCYVIAQVRATRKWIRFHQGIQDCAPHPQVGILIGGLDDVAPILTNFFLVTYALTNLATALLGFSGVPNWRPHFRYFHRYMSALGCVLTLAAMIYLNVLFAVITVSMAVALFLYVTLFFKERLFL